MIAAAYYTCRYMIIWVNLTRKQRSFAQMCIKPKNKIGKNMPISICVKILKVPLKYKSLRQFRLLKEINLPPQAIRQTGCIDPSRCHTIYCSHRQPRTLCLSISASRMQSKNRIKRWKHWPCVLMRHMMSFPIRIDVPLRKC